MEEMMSEVHRRYRRFHSRNRRKAIGEVNFVDLQTAEYKCEVTTYKLLSECRRMVESLQYICGYAKLCMKHVSEVHRRFHRGFRRRLSRLCMKHVSSRSLCNIKEYIIIKT
jgi:hypothetical protein